MSITGKEFGQLLSKVESVAKAQEATHRLVEEVSNRTNDIKVNCAEEAEFRKAVTCQLWDNGRSRIQTCEDRVKVNTFSLAGLWGTITGIIVALLIAWLSGHI